MNHQKLMGTASAIAEVIGDSAEQVILFGSQTTGNANEKSDVDMAIIVSKTPNPHWKLQGKATRLAKAMLNSEVDLLMKTREEFERNKQPHLNIEAKIALVRVLFNNGKSSECIQEDVSLNVLRVEAASRMMASSAHLLARAYRWENLGEPILNQDACVASMETACRAVRALLVMHYVDTSVKGVRWNLARLTTLAADYNVIVADKAVEAIHEYDVSAG